MARRQPDLRTRTARAKLTVGHDHTAAVARGVALVYRRADRRQAGAWRVRKVDPRKVAGYSFGRLGPADDLAEGLGLSYEAAAAAALDWEPATGAPVAAGEGDCPRCGKKLAEGGPLTEMPDYSAPEPAPGEQRPRMRLHQACYRVRDAVAEYLEHYEANYRSGDRARYALEAHLLPALGDVPVVSLKAARVSDFQEALAARPALLAGRRGNPNRKTREATTDRQRRARRVSANSIMAKAKAALNRCADKGRVLSTAREAWASVKPLPTGHAEPPRWLTRDEATRLLNVIEDDDLRQLVLALILTGARVGELRQLRVEHFNSEAGVLTIPGSIAKTGRGRGVALTDEGQELFEQLTAGRGRGERIFRRRGRPWGKDDHNRPLSIAYEVAGITGANAYSLRHSTAAWAKLAGVPSYLIAQQLGNSAALIEEVYGQLTTSHAGEAMRAALPRLTAPAPPKVERLSPRRRRA